MKRDFLKGLGLTDEQIEQVMAENGKDVQAEVQKASAHETTVAELQKQLADRDKDIEDLQKQSGNSSELQKKLEDLQSKYETDTSMLNQRLNDQRLDAALDAAIHGAKGRNPKAIKALIDRDKLELRDDGILKGLDLEALKKSDAYLFEIETTKDEGQGASGGSGSSPAGVVTQETFQQNINNVAWMQANMDAVTQGLANGSLTKG